MAAAPPYKVYNPQREYIAACHHLEDAACLAALNGDGTTIRLGHSLIVWYEGRELQPAAESYDNVVRVCHERIESPTWHNECLTGLKGGDA